jgi:hypothetical protein
MESHGDVRITQCYSGDSLVRVLPAFTPEVEEKLFRRLVRNCMPVWLYPAYEPVSASIPGNAFSVQRTQTAHIAIAIPLLGVFLVGNIHVVTRGTGLQNQSLTQCIMMRVLPNADHTRTFAGYGAHK